MNKRLITISASAVFLFSGCSTGLFSGEESAPPTVPVTAPAPIVVDGVRTSYADIVEKASPAVVQIEAEIRAGAEQRRGPRSPFEDFFRQFPDSPERQPPTQRGVGSGVIVSADGTILTNAHVIDGAERITVILNDSRTFNATLVGQDSPSDLAVLKIETQNMPYLNLGNSDAVRIGDIVLAIGNPLGIGQTVTAGIISAKGRRTGLSDGSFEDFLQTDAPINRGNSGGALINLSGELIGINSQILSTTGGNIGIGFSIPSNMAKNVMEQLLQTGTVRRGMLGVSIQNITGDTAQALELPDTSGVIVSNVRSGSAAEKAGIRRGDIITGVNGDKIDDGNVLRNKIAGTLPGSEVKLTILRDGQSQEVTAVLDEFDVESAANRQDGNAPQGPAPQAQSGKLGATLQPMTPQLSRQFGTGDETDGLVVTEVAPNGAASQAGIARGDIILEVNRQAVSTPEAVEQALQQAGNRPVLLLISRRGSPIFVTVRPSN